MIAKSANGHWRPAALFTLGLGLSLLTNATVGFAADKVRSPGRPLPNIVLITVDTLRADRLSIYGNAAPVSPNIDALLSRGTRFSAARTPEPLTTPAFASMLTSLHPHEHGASRNGIPIEPGLRSLPTMLTGLGYVTAAFVSNWTLTDKQSGLTEHFDVYREVLTEKRWLFWFGEADAEDVRLRTLEWLEDDGVYPGQPLFLWVHFVEPHAPYKLHEEFAPKVGVPDNNSASATQRYDTEIAAADAQIGRLLSDLEAYLEPAETLWIFTSDHGEGLGEHGYKGHGRRLYEEELRIPLGFTWEDHIPSTTFRAPASLLDVAPTILGLLGAPSPPEWRGYDWSTNLLGGEDGEMDRITYYQAHKGAVKGSTTDVDVAVRKRQRGLLQVGYVQGQRKLVLETDNGSVTSYQLPESPAGGKMNYAACESSDPTRAQPERLPAVLSEWYRAVDEGLSKRDRAPPPEMDDETLEKLRSLGYIN